MSAQCRRFLERCAGRRLKPEILAVTVGGKNLFACVDGPEFNAHEVDFASLTDRLTAYRDHERSIWTRLQADPAHQCKLQAALAETESK